MVKNDTLFENRTYFAMGVQDGAITLFWKTNNNINMLSFHKYDYSPELPSLMSMRNKIAITWPIWKSNPYCIEPEKKYGSIRPL